MRLVKVGQMQRAKDIAKPSRLSAIMKFAAKASFGVSLVVAGAALAQAVGPNPTLPSVDKEITSAPPKIDTDQAPAPGTKREAIACSRDIVSYCAYEADTRRNVRQCLAAKASLISQSCKAHLERVYDDADE